MTPSSSTSATNELDFSDLVELLRLCESASEHPLARAIIAKAKRVNMSQKVTKFNLLSFENINGEGVVASISRKNDPKNNPSSPDAPLQVLCGNDKLMDRFGVDLDFNSFRMNMESYEVEGKTVVCMAVQNVPRLLVSLKEDHIAKVEAQDVVDYV